ncbi:MAG: helix-turn-helix domain-containing protein [Ruminococcaceae bacterium]|nr:helix-turn-helix domain-containing protein [Oscillospiraceae bacterium]
MIAFYENQVTAFYCRNLKDHSLECAAHLHYNVEIAFIYEGETDVMVDNHSIARAVGGDIVLVFPNQMHSFYTLQKERHILLIFDPKLLPELSSVFTEHLPANNIVRGAANDKELRSLIERISDAAKKDTDPYGNIVLRGYLLAFLGRLFEMAEFKKINAEDIHAIGSVMNYCIAHYSENLSLDLLEKKLHISKYYISHIMNKKLNMGFNDYVNQIRISNACRKLAESDMPISQISEAVGFCTVRTFNRAFAKHVGMTPREYRSKRFSNVV